MGVEVPVEVALAPKSHEVAAHLVIEIVVEGALYSVAEQDANQARPAFDGRRHLLDHGSHSPFVVKVVVDSVAES